jgi:hypothetical protein
MRPPHALKQLRTLAALAPLLLATACGGGFYFGSGDFDDGSAPTVSIEASASTVPAGQSVTLVASASDNEGVDSVAFYRVDNETTNTLLGSDGSSPFQLNATAPTDGRTTLVVFARATDSSGNTTDSSTIAITVTVTP